MQRRTFLGAAGGAALAGAAKRMNILLITGDDLGLQLGCYGEKRIRTPHMDALAASGVRFETAYVTQASCSPSRSSIFTGLYPHTNGQYGLANTGFALHPHLHKAIIPAVLKTAGYRTGIIGKLHVEPESVFPFDFRPRTDMRKVRGIAAEARNFLGAGAGAPFFLMVNFADPHAFRYPDDPNRWFFPPEVDGFPAKPLPPGPQTLWDWQGVDATEHRKRTANYLNAVDRLDTGVGMVLDELKQAGRLEDTVVILLGDNGPAFERGKTTCYEAGLRTPFLVRWPGVSSPAVRKELVSTVDIAPTIYDAAGVEAPVALEGRSLRPVLAGSAPGWREYLAGEFQCHGARNFFPRRALRDQRYKLIHNLRAGKGTPATGIDGDDAWRTARETRYDGTPVREAFERYADPPEFEFYDLQSDPVEFVNLAGNRRVRAAAGAPVRGHDEVAPGDEGPVSRRRVPGAHGPARFKMSSWLSRRELLLSAAAAAPVFAGVARPSTPAVGELRRDILATLDYPRVALHRARVFTRVFQATEDKPWEVRKAMALREHFRTVPLYLRPGDRLAGSISRNAGRHVADGRAGLRRNRHRHESAVARLPEGQSAAGNLGSTGRRATCGAGSRRPIRASPRPSRPIPAGRRPTSSSPTRAT